MLLCLSFVELHFSALTVTLTYHTFAFDNNESGFYTVIVISLFISLYVD